MDWTKTTARQDEKYLSFGIWCDLYKRFYGTLGIIGQLNDTSSITQTFDKIFLKIENIASIKTLKSIIYNVSHLIQSSMFQTLKLYIKNFKIKVWNCSKYNL